MPTPAFWFDREEYFTRLSCVWAEMKKRDLNGQIALLPETVTGHEGYFTRAYLSFGKWLCHV